jgi:hypothetical protein
MIASRVAANLTNEKEVSVEMVKGGLGELSVTLDEKKIFSTNPLWYPTPSGVIRKVRAALAL